MFSTMNERLVPLGPANSGVPPKRTRSRTGCLTCRRRKKKCDETRPQCSSCSTRGLECEWGMKHYTVSTLKPRVERRRSEPMARAASETRRASQPARAPDPWPMRELELAPLPVTSLLNSEEIFGDVIDVYTPGSQALAGYDSQTTFQGQSTYAGDTPRDPTRPVVSTSFEPDTPTTQALVSGTSYSIPEFDFSFLNTPLSTFNLFLDPSGLEYLEYFESQVAPLLSMLPTSSNYFLKTFFAAAAGHECISNAIAAWGALFRDQDLAIVNRYLKRAREALEREAGLDKDVLFVLFSFYLILLGIQVCSGDVSNWYGLFNKCVDVLKQVGGVAQFLKVFQYSNDAKFLITNFQIHDIMLSSGLTICSINLYSDVVKLLEYNLADYGVDPFQGCIQPLFLLLGEMINANAELAGERRELDDRMALALAAPCDDSDTRTLAADRTAHLLKVEREFNALLSRVRHCKPLPQIHQIADDSERRAHLKLFEVYRTTCQLYLLLYIKQVGPKAAEVQLLLVSQIAQLEELAQLPRLVLGLNMALIISGVACSNNYDKNRVTRLVTVVYQRYNVGNVRRIRDLIKEIWKRNPTGEVCVDWTQVCRDFDWKLSVC